MPQISMRGIETEKVKSISKEMVDALEALLECPRDYFSIECVNTTFIKDGSITVGYPFIEIAWFDRGQELQDRVAEVITKYVQSTGYENVDVVFRVLEKNKYYENGKHF
jgi:hypothetical protein